MPIDAEKERRGEHRDPKPDANSSSRRSFLLTGASLAAFSATGALAPQIAEAQQGPAATSASGQPPNILVIWGDDIGWQNVSAYGMGTMGYTTPNIDRVGKEG